MRTLVLDWGNSSLKYGVFDGSELLDHGRMTDITLVDLEPWVHGMNVESVVAASTGPDVEPFVASLQDDYQTFILRPESTVPLHMEYTTPETLGMDRKAVAVAAAAAHPDQYSLVIDCGTCITFDVVAPGRRYLGGSISPGLQMRLRSMHEFTERLPWVKNAPDNSAWPGKSTHDSLWQGGLKGWQLEIEGYIRQMKQEHPHLNVILTGGDAQYFESTENLDIFADPFYVLRGLNEIFTHHAGT